MFDNTIVRLCMIYKKHKVNKRVGYDQWSTKETSVLLEIMVDAANREWLDNSGIFTKQIVEDRIIPSLNSKLGYNKTFNNYQSRLRWFKNRWNSYSTLLKFNSGFQYEYKPLCLYSCKHVKYF